MRFYVQNRCDVIGRVRVVKGRDWGTDRLTVGSLLEDTDEVISRAPGSSNRERVLHLARRKARVYDREIVQICAVSRVFAFTMAVGVGRQRVVTRHVKVVARVVYTVGGVCNCRDRDLDLVQPTRVTDHVGHGKPARVAQCDRGAGVAARTGYEDVVLVVATVDSGTHRRHAGDTARARNAWAGDRGREVADAHRVGVDLLREGDPEGQFTVCASTRRVVDRAQKRIDGVDHVVRRH